MYSVPRPSTNNKAPMVVMGIRSQYAPSLPSVGVASRDYGESRDDENAGRDGRPLPPTVTPRLARERNTRKRLEFSRARGRPVQCNMYRITSQACAGIAHPFRSVRTAAAEPAHREFVDDSITIALWRTPCMPGGALDAGSRVSFGVAGSYNIDFGSRA